jgi:hypothetical protein
MEKIGPMSSAMGLSWPAKSRPDGWRSPPRKTTSAPSTR